MNRGSRLHWRVESPWHQTRLAEQRAIRTSGQCRGTLDQGAWMQTLLHGLAGRGWCRGTYERSRGSERARPLLRDTVRFEVLPVRAVQEAMQARRTQPSNRRSTLGHCTKSQTRQRGARLQENSTKA